MSDKINPCPFCGNKDVFISDDGWVSYVKCEKCGADGPFTEDDSFLEKWNNAAAPELYEALEQLVITLDRSGMKIITVDAHAALAKARGES